MPQPSVDKTLFDKIWDAHYVATRPDDRDLVYIDRHVLHELHAPHAFEKLAKTKRGVRRPDLTFSMQDHTVSTKPGRTDTTFPAGAAFLQAMRAGSAKHAIRVFDLGDPERRSQGPEQKDPKTPDRDAVTTSFQRNRLIDSRIGVSAFYDARSDGRAV